jgi:hypothetical protein
VSELQLTLESLRELYNRVNRLIDTYECAIGYAQDVIEDGDWPEGQAIEAGELKRLHRILQSEAETLRGHFEQLPTFIFQADLNYIQNTLEAHGYGI